MILNMIGRNVKNDIIRDYKGLKTAADLSAVAPLREGEGCVLAHRARQEGV